MKISTVAFAFTLAATAAVAHADELQRPCTTKAECTKQVGCKTGFTRVAAGGAKFYCQKVETDVEKEKFACSKGTLKAEDGIDSCQWQASRTPECSKIGLGPDDWEWNKKEKKCRRVANNGDVKWETSNIECDSGLTYKPASGKCEGTVRDGWSLSELFAKCTAQLGGSIPMIDYVGNTDYCVKTTGDITYAAPSI